jgi:tRNA dimethylallyltransferase
MHHPLATLLAGPTASGKSALALRLARDRGALVVNADSMQVYEGLRVLSARPSLAEEAEAPHRLYGFVAPGVEFSVGRYLEALTPLVEAARAGGPPLVIVGGTGLYFRAMSEGLVPTPAVPLAIRDLWRAKAAAGEDLHAALMQRDPARAGALNPADTPRLLRAIELFEASGKPYSQWISENAGAPLLRAGEWRGVFLNPPREAVLSSIETRFLGMMESGALAEVQALLALSPPLSRNLGVMKAHGVPHLADFIEGRITRAQAVERGTSDTRRYARRQVIFAKKYLAGEGWRWIERALPEP